MSVADVVDVAALLGRSLTEAESNQVQAMLDGVEVILRHRVGDLLDRADTDDLYRSLVVLVEAKAVRRVMMNPGGVRQRSETVDDYTQSETLDTAVSTGDFYVTPDEWQLLGGGSSSSGSFSMAGGYP